MLRKLQNSLLFSIKIENRVETYGQYWAIEFFRHTGEPFRDYDKLTSSQWLKAKQYLTRDLKPFRGYEYSVREEYKINKTYNII